MSTLTKFSAIPYTGPAPTNRQPYVPAEAPKADERGRELAAKLNQPELLQESGQDVPTFVVPKENIVQALSALKAEGYTLPLDLWRNTASESLESNTHRRNGDAHC